MLWSYMAPILFYGLPVLAVLFFAVSLFLYCHGRHRNKIHPGSVPAETMRIRKIVFIVSAVIAGIFVTVVLGFAALLLMAVAFM
ncbi:MAG: hypothetical protein IKY52_07240 [Clostridia bacterium]|nr:hypothetical protein [Clostridia bacterium]